MEALRTQGEEEREGWAAANLEKARQKVRESDDNMCRLERSIWTMEDIVAKEAKVKDDVVDEVVEVEVEETVEEKVKKEVEEKAVEEKAVRVRQWLRVFWEAREAGSIQDLPWDPTVLAGPHPRNLDQPLLVPPESEIWNMLFLMHCVHHKILGLWRSVSADEGGGPPRQTPAGGGGGGSRGLVVAIGVAHKEEGGGAPPPSKRGEDV